MSLEFAIVPFDNSFVSAAYEIENKLRNKIRLQLDVVVDTNYHTSFASRINKWKKQDYDVITIDQEYSSNNIIIVRFCDNGSKAQAMYVDKFIELVASYDDDDTEEENVEETPNTGGCILM